MNEAAIEEAAYRGYVWGMPLVEAALIRKRFTQGQSAKDTDTPINAFKHRRMLSGPEMRAGVGPNNYTIYSSAWLDLADGPLIVTAPDFGNRYYAFSINLADSSSDQSLGQRTHGGQLPPLFVHGPGWRGPIPRGMVDVPVSTRYVGVAGRILVRSPAEYPEVHALQDRLAVVRWADWRKGKRIAASATPQRELAQGSVGTPPDLAFFHQLGAILQDWIVRPQDKAAIAALEPLGISRKSGFQPNGLSAGQLSALARGYARAKEDVRLASLRLGVERNGWTTNDLGPRFGSDNMLRAAVAKDQIFVAVPEEAIYPIARVDAAGCKLDGSHRYRIRFAAGELPPVDAFWSITAYDDTGFMIANNANRYSVGDRTGGLVMDRDGSVTIELAATPPPPERASANWLPVAADAPFYLMMRLYRPQPSVLDRTWVPPAIERID
ncbi:DUF1214 domain-containing protein [Novosphingobium sp. SL115]|uniref:DUF1254 domain-containing protein n=1 Tax=Novosphingobium sp. SL115 TaxID=2995150 RepID=UPI002275B8CD|nr:DUF1214 domain-containing protein [Novosphingobium sp. SL115]MCY1669666.1 DUF1214 domain-containing protein [Novosphingobium sp. SL115]